jgi:Lar family restriction alleviation protein
MKTLEELQAAPCFMPATDDHLMASAPTVFELGGKKLKPCPFCGGDQLTVLDSENLFWIHCMRCQTDGPVRDSRLNAMKIWQLRNP